MLLHLHDLPLSPTERRRIHVGRSSCFFQAHRPDPSLSGSPSLQFLSFEEERPLHFIPAPWRAAKPRPAGVGLDGGIFRDRDHERMIRGGGLGRMDCLDGCIDSSPRGVAGLGIPLHSRESRPRRLRLDQDALLLSLSRALAAICDILIAKCRNYLYLLSLYILVGGWEWRD